MSWWEKPPLKVRRRISAKRFRDNVRALHSKLVRENEVLKKRVLTRGLSIDQDKEFDMDTLRLMAMEDGKKSRVKRLKEGACQIVQEEENAAEDLDLQTKCDLAKSFIGALNKTLHRRDAKISRDKRNGELKFLSEEIARLAWMLT